MSLGCQMLNASHDVMLRMNLSLMVCQDRKRVNQKWIEVSAEDMLDHISVDKFRAIQRDLRCEDFF